MKNMIDYYDKILLLINYFSFHDCGLAYTIGDYYYNENNKDVAIKYYEKIFKKGFDLSRYGYFYSLERYINLLSDSKVKILKEIIDYSNSSNKYELDAIDTYLLLIINLEKFSDQYLEYINKGIKIATKVVREYQKNSSHRSSYSFSDSDEERDLCELIALKMEYYVHKKEYREAFKLYQELTDEIGKSDCTRYYHARDKFYMQMLKDMSEDYPELRFFEDIGYYKFRLLSEYKDLKKGQEITLQKADGLAFKFVIESIYEENDITIAPILPLLGEGGFIFTNLIKEEDNIYLQNKLSH